MEWTILSNFKAEVGPHLPTTKGWKAELAVGLGTTTVSKQSAQDRNITVFTVVSCSSRHASLNNFSTGERRTHYLSGRDADH